MKLNLGSGNVRMADFTNVDLYDDDADVKADLNALPYADNSVDEIACIQVIEHIHYAESEKVISEMYRVLRPGGFAVIECPDIEVIAKRIVDTGEITENTIQNLYGQYWRPQDQNRYKDWYHHEGSIHRNPWNYKRLADMAEKLGFTVERIPMEQMQYKYEENLACKLTKLA